ncbi:hypothetical protein LQ318_01435 [Aliifodinibius salicampi]|uniref:Uncharacterized protein n=1 Tax=Fodinibius salicampi TaxID=1920655 RepID=A0ABT3PUQ1_9BACT|nr:hypothetical protein [Fodinibius salicampi]MCW9711553.1 hypothetical protein [Fodinibius salicampi]
MLTFYKNTSTPFTRRIEEKLKEMVVAHEVVEADSNGSLPDTLTRNQLPALSDGYQIWTAPEKIEKILEKLHRELKLSRSMQSDTCHLDPDNPDKCL